MAHNFDEPRPYEQYLLTLALLLISALLIYTQGAKRLDLLAYDTLLSLNPAPIETNTVIIAIDEKSLNSIGQWPWRRALHAQLVDKLTAYNTELLVLDILFSEQSRTHPEDDELLAKAIRNNGNVILPLHLQSLTHEGTLVEILPIPELVTAARALGHVHVDLDQDGLARGLYLNTGVGDAFWPSLSMAMASQINPMIRYTRHLENPGSAPYMAVNTQYKLIPFAGPSGTFPTYSYVDVMLNQVPADVFRNKTVLIGATAPGLGDIIPTPVSHTSNPMSGVELHANAYSALITGTAITPVETLWAYLLTFAFILIPILAFPRLKPTYVMPFSMLLATIIMLFSYLLLALDETWFPPVNSMISILIAYPLWSWQRMRHLNGFLNNELEKLQKEPAIGFRDTRQHQPEKIFFALKQVLKPKRYIFIKNNAVLEQLVESDSPFEVIDTGAKWLHHSDMSVLSIHRQLDKKSYDNFFIGFRWPANANLTAIHDYLNKLKIETTTPPSRKHSYEKIANRIAQVREAIESMQDMRIFISKGFEDIPSAVIVCDPLGMVVFTNSHAQRWFFHNTDPLGASIYELLSGTEFNALKDRIAAVLTESRHENLELELNHRHIIAHCSPFMVDETTDSGLMLSFSDITLIRNQQKEKNQLIDFLSHDVRSPLVSQLAMIDSMTKGKTKIDRSSLTKLADHARKSLSLSDQFLQITRAEQISEQQFYEFDLISTLENSIDSLSAQAKAKDIQIHFDQTEEAWMQGNAELVERALTNLISNAIKYSKDGTEIKIQVILSSTHVSIVISDQGYGIDQAELPHIFNRFHRQRSSEIQGQKGAGLGLNFVKVVVEKHHGDIKVHSVMDQGSTFSLHFPLQNHA
jgi:CHASE2 domain-containing sensor protein/signal transduction histidine kinase